MKSLIIAYLAFVVAGLLRANDEAILAQVKAADDLRVSAMIAGDPVRLDEVLSDGLHYAHSEKLIESKAEHIGRLASRQLIYQKMDFKKREFSVIAPGAVACYGRALVDVGSERMIFRVDIHFLAVWRLENQRWRLFAWQSSRIEEIVPIGPSHELPPNKPAQNTHQPQPRVYGNNSSQRPLSLRRSEANVIEIAREYARLHSIDLESYRRPKIGAVTLLGRATWIVSYARKHSGISTSHDWFSLTIDDETGSAESLNGL